MPTLSALENITLPMDLAGTRRTRSGSTRSSTPWAFATACAIGPRSSPAGSSSASPCARALASRPTVIFADEPTGNLDSKASGEILDVLARLRATMGQTIVMVTHDPAAAGFADRAVFLADGRVVDEMLTRRPSRSSTA